MITLKICQKQPFDAIAMNSKGTLMLCCAHIAQLVTHLEVMLQVSWHTAGSN